MFKNICLDDLHKTQRAIKTFQNMGGGGRQKLQKIPGYAIDTYGYQAVDGKWVTEEEVRRAAKKLSCDAKQIVARLDKNSKHDALTTPIRRRRTK